MRKVHLVMLILIILLWAVVILIQSETINIMEVGDLLGYLYYVIIIVGIVAVISLFVKPVKKGMKET